MATIYTKVIIVTEKGYNKPAFYHYTQDDELWTICDSPTPIPYINPPITNEEDEGDIYDLFPQFKPKRRIKSEKFKNRMEL